VSRQAQFYMKMYGRKTYRNRHDFILYSPLKHHIRACRRSLTWYFVGSFPAIFTIPTLLLPSLN